MKISIALKICAFSLTTALALTACSGGGGGGVAVGGTPTASSGFIDTFNSASSSPQSQNTAAFFGLFDDKFLDNGYTKANLIANVTADSAAIADASVAADSVFPQVLASDSSITECNPSTNVCSLNTTYTMTGPDATAVTTKIPVLVDGSKITIVGNGSNLQPS